MMQAELAYLLAVMLCTGLIMGGMLYEPMIKPTWYVGGVEGVA